MQRFNWSPGIGDPTFMGWFTVVLYLLTAWLAWRMAQRLLAYDRQVHREVATWRTISALFFALGINKQLDLQTAFTELGRIVALHQGWYGSRANVQIAFIAMVALACVLAAVFIALQIRHALRPNGLAILGTVLVLGYVLIRAASFHHVDWFIGQRQFGVKWNWILEISGISLVLFSIARRYAMMAETQAKPAGEATR